MDGKDGKDGSPLTLVGIACEWADWVDWSSCLNHAKLGCARSRDRYIKTYPQDGGAVCKGAKTEFVACTQAVLTDANESCNVAGREKAAMLEPGDAMAEILEEGDPVVKLAEALEVDQLDFEKVASDGDP